MATVNWSLQHFTDTAANFTANNPTLLAGQLGIETDGLTTTPKFKIGDGTSTWTALPYFYGGSASAQNLNNVLSVGNTTSGNNIVMSGTDVISDSTGTNMFVDLNASTIYSTDGLNRMAFTADISGKTSEISVRDYSVITLEKGYVSAGLTDIYSGVISQSTGWYNQIHTNLSHIEVQSNWANFRGIEYLNDWSANYSLRSLVDKGYVINNFVPYTGATSDVDLGAYLLSTKSIRVTGTSGSGDIHLRHQSADATATGQSTSLFADVNGDLKWKNDGNYYTTLKTSTNTANRIYTYPDADGTIALTSNKLSQFATTTSSELAGVISDETGTGALVFGTSPTFTTDITTPLIIGGSAVGSTIQYKGTSGNGTSTVAAHQFLVGNNGATTALQILNNGKISVGTPTLTNQRIFTISQDTAFLSIGSDIATGQTIRFFANQATPSATNFSFDFNQTDTTINAPSSSGSLVFQIGNSSRGLITNYRASFGFSGDTSGAVTSFNINIGAHTGQSSGVEISNFKVNGASKTWAAGAITTQRWNYFTANTAAFASASTITNSYGLYVEAATAGTNATITNNYAAGFGGAVSISEGTASMKIGNATDGTGNPSIFFNQTTYTLANAALTGGQFSTALNSNNNVLIRISNQTRINITNTEQSFTPAIATSGAATNFTFTSSANTGQSAGVEISNFKVNGASKTWANGGGATTIATQRWNYFTANTAATSGGGSLTITNSYGLYAEAATASGVTITNNYAAGFDGNVHMANTSNCRIIFAATNSYIQGAANMRIVGSEVFFDAGGATATIRTTNTLWQNVDGLNFQFGSSNGSKIGTATTQKIGFWNATPIVQPTTAVAAATFVANTSGIANDTATFDGYTIGQVVKALRNVGLLA